MAAGVGWVAAGADGGVDLQPMRRSDMRRSGGMDGRGVMRVGDAIDFGQSDTADLLIALLPMMGPWPSLWDSPNSTSSLLNPQRKL